MPMYNLPEDSKNYRKTTSSLWNFYRDQTNNGTDVNNITRPILNSKSFDYKANVIENGVTNNNLIKNNVKIAVPLNIWAIFGEA